MTRLFLLLTLLIQTSQAAVKPNVVFILADDLGWADTTLYGHTKLYRTPNLERLAKRGMTFNRAYAASPLCSPTRSSILTGLHPARTGITEPNCHEPQVVLTATPGTSGPAGKKSVAPNPPTRLNTTWPTMSKAFKAAGYATGHFGKWHLGPEPYSPLQQGFDVDVPHYAGPGPAGSYVAPWKFPDFDPQTPNEHIEDRMAKEAVAFLEKHKDEPFFLNYWMFSVHAPFDAKKALIEKYRGKVDPADPQHSPTYAAMVESMDDAVGTLIDTLDRLNLTDHTILVFFSDNGGNMYDTVDGTTPTSNAPLRGGKATVFEGGVREPCVVSWPGNVKPDTRSDTVIQSIDFYPTLLEATGLTVMPGQKFDGISILPALKGETLTRKAIFTYFPHDPGVPDWLPPSVTVTQGDWKLIRIFFGGENGQHRWKLYNLHEDESEKHDLAASDPERVKTMDALIEKFLTDTQAVQPIRNPAFDPAQYHPELEGVQNNRDKEKPKRAPAKKTAAAEQDKADPALQGWKARQCSASVTDGVVTITGQGNAPFLGVSAAGTDGPAVMKFRTRCAGGGEGKVEWILAGKNSPPAKSVPFTLKPGEWQEIRVNIPAEGAISIVRLYLPAQQQKVELDWVELTGKTKPKRWNF